jgi:nucleoside-diphosphate-sugar epimerase
MKIWAAKMKCLQDALQHPAIKSGEMTYTVIGCGEFWDCPDEPLLCPWLETDKEIVKDGYSILSVGNPDAKMDYSTRTDVAKFYVASLRHPDRCENKTLGCRSDHISYTEIASLLAEYSGKPVRTNVISLDDMSIFMKDASLAPKELQRGSTFPLSFLMVL